MPAEIDYNPGGTIKTIWLDVDAAPFIDIMLDCIEQAEARKKVSAADPKSIATQL